MLKRGIILIKKNDQLINLIIYGIGQFFNLVTPLLVAPYVISVCGIDGYGKASLAMALMFFLIVFIDYGSDINGVKEISINRDNPSKLEQIFKTILTVKLMSLIIILIISLLIFNLVPYFVLEKKLFIFSLFILLGQFLNPTWYLQGIENFKQITKINIISKLIFVGAIFLFISEETDYIYINLWWGVGMIIANLISLIYLFISNSFSFRPIKKQFVVEHFKFGFSIFSSQIFVSLQMYGPIILVGFLGSEILAGIYRVVDQVIVVFKTYILLFFNFVFSRVCYLLAKNKSEGIRFWLIFNGANFFFILISMILVFLFANSIVEYFNVSKISEIVNLLKIATLIPLTMAVSVPLKQLVLGFNNEKQYIRITMTVVLINILLIIISIPFFELLGVFLSLLFSELLITCLFYISIKNNFFLRSS